MRFSSFFYAVSAIGGFIVAVLWVLGVLDTEQVIALMLFVLSGYLAAVYNRITESE